MEDELLSLGDFIDKAIVKCLKEYDRKKESLADSEEISPLAVASHSVSSSAFPQPLAHHKLTDGQTVCHSKGKESLQAPTMSARKCQNMGRSTVTEPEWHHVQSVLDGADLVVVGCSGVSTVWASSAADKEQDLREHVIGCELDSSELGQSDSETLQPKLHKQSEYKATDKVKKRLQQRYYEASDPDASKTETTESYRVENCTQVSSRKIGKWKKRRLQKAEDAVSSTSHSKASKHKRQKTQAKSSSFQEELAGYLVFDSDEEAEGRLSQTEIAQAVDVTSAAKYFELNLKDFGPYNINYSRNGRHLLLGGCRGHMAAFDWQTKKLCCEFNAMETVNSVRWLHQETLFAAAQRSGVNVYDNQGIEIHALQNLDCVLRMEFLPYHMLLATANEKGFLGYTDVSMGTRVAGICTGLGRLDTMTQNPANAIIHLGHASGTVTLWTPNEKGPVIKMLCHKAPVRALAVDQSGNYMATSGVDKRVKVFDLRSKKMLNSTRIAMGASSLAFSQRGLLASALGSRVQVYKDVCRETSVISPYLNHLCAGTVQQLQFCPFEDVLGVGHQRGFSSLIVPGSGEANVDAMEINPMATKKQRQNAEVKLLLDKLQPEMIGLTNWVAGLKPRSTAIERAPKQTAKKLGKKQQEEHHREVRRAHTAAAVASSHTPDPADPLARFKKR